MDVSGRKSSSCTRSSDSRNVNMNEDDDDFIFKPKKKATKSANPRPQKSGRKLESTTRSRNSRNAEVPNPNLKDEPAISEAGIDTDNAYIPDEDAFNSFCPICQVPFTILKILPEMHTSSCDIADNLPGCPMGNQCSNETIFHYRDFNHREIAAYRASEDYHPPPKTPKKKSKTPRKRSTGKKRLLGSPGHVHKVSKVGRYSPIATESTSKDKHTEVSDKEVSFETRKRLFCEDETSKPSENPSSINLVSNVTDALTTVKEEFPFWPKKIIKTEIFEEETDETAVPMHTEVDLDIKNEEVRQSGTPNFIESNEVPRHQLNAHLDLKYEFDSEVFVKAVTTVMRECDEGCRKAVSGVDTVQAFCSVSISSVGMRGHAAAARSPVTLNLAMNSTGWEGLSIRGKSSASVRDINVSLCECSNSLGVTCIVKDSQLNLPGEDLEEKASFSLRDLGLKNQSPQRVEPSHQVSILTSCEPKSSSAVSDVPVKLENDKENVNCDKLPSKETTTSDSLRPHTPSDAATPLFVTPHASDTSRSHSPVVLEGTKAKTPVIFQKIDGAKTRAGTPTPFPMVASKSSSNGFTLYPVLGVKQSAATSKFEGRKVPSYKRIPDTPFVVDAFNYGIIPGVKIYFLSHFHSDHYMGLRKGFNQPVFCSQVTANLAHMKLGVPNEHLHVLKFGEPRVVLGVEVEIFDANHCPGAVMFLFRLASGQTFLHVGDFRAHVNMEQNQKLRRVDKLYLDTTYCDPLYDFPSQEEVIQKVVETARQHLEQNPSTLFVCGSYTIGKEKVFKGIAETFGWKIWAGAEKVKVLRCLDDQTLISRLTKDPIQAQVHVLSMRDISFEFMQNHLKKYSPKFNNIVGFKPTGWTTSTSLKGKVSDFQRHCRGSVTIYGVPYSEHSSFSELRRFVQFVRPSDIQATVNLNKTGQFKKIFQQWLSNSSDGTGQSTMTKFLLAKKL